MQVIAIDEMGLRKRGRSIRFDTGFEVATSQAVVKVLHIRVGTVCDSSEAEFIALIARNARECARKRTLDLMARRDYTSHEVAQRLCWDGYDEALAIELTNHLEDIGLLDDERYTYGFCATKLEAGYGPHVITAKLEQKGIEGQKVKDAIDAYIQNEQFNPVVSARMRIEDLDLDDQAQRQKALRRLVSRGFSYDVVREVLDHPAYTCS